VHAALFYIKVHYNQHILEHFSLNTVPIFTLAGVVGLLPQVDYTVAMRFCNEKGKYYLLLAGRWVVYLFACIGFVLVAGYLAVRFGLTKTTGIIDTQTEHFILSNDSATTYVTFPLAHTPEWIAFRQAVAKDIPIITKVSNETGVPARLLVAILVPEQMRLFHSDRPVFKRFFEPLKMLGSQSQFSFGIFGIKEETAITVENNLRNPSSSMYLGKKYENLLTFSSSTAISQERFARITDEYNHMYAYRYAALFIAQITSQWKKSGHPIDARPEIVATLWNVGFSKSKPHKNPQSGGSVLTINNTEYSFGEIARLFYYSDEMIELFPIQ
jgi:hypothetical protein